MTILGSQYLQIEHEQVKAMIKISIINGKSLRLLNSKCLDSDKEKVEMEKVYKVD
jgi:hypothetical protein